MKRPLGSFLFVTLLVVLAALAGRDAPWPAKQAVGLPARPALSGQVVDSTGPVQAARVRLQGSPVSALTDEEGRFQLPVSVGQSERITAWKSGYLIEGVPLDGKALRIELRRLPPRDYVGYAWVDPTPDASEPDRCGNCHAQIYDEWHAGGHANSAVNRRFLGLYEGTDWKGRPGHGWSLTADHPLGIGVCAACHAPGVDFEGGASDDMRQVKGVAAQGVHCDFCHKIRDVDSGAIGFAHGRFGYQLLRPRQGQLFFGPLDDVDRGEDAFSPLQSESRYCASCHEGVVFGVHVYSTYSEWLDSPAGRQGRHCQSCHMEPTGNMNNIAPGAGGIDRDPSTLASHTLLPGGREAMLKRSLHVNVDVEPGEDSLICRVTLVARDVGHRVPTGFVDRHLLLVVQPLDAEGRCLQASAGPELPAEAGQRLAGLPGKIYGRRLVDEAGSGPVPFWRAAKLAHDTRLVPDHSDTSRFELPATTNRIRVRVLYRRFWQSVALAKHWPDDTIAVHDQQWPVAK